MVLNLPEKRYYKIGEISKAFNVNSSLLRFWEKEFKHINPKKNKKGDRMYTIDDVEKLKLIYHLVKEKGFTLEGAKNKLKHKPEKVINNFDIISRLERVKEELIKIKKQVS